MRIRHLACQILLSSLALAVAAASGAGPGASQVPVQAPPMRLEIDAHAPSRPFPHYWERMFGSGRAVLSLREAYRHDLERVKAVTGLGYVRFHGIFDDEVGLFDLEGRGAPRYNFSYVDQIYDGLLARGVRPFVELSFMPHRLARDPRQDFTFWYKPNISPPRAYALWDGMIEAFARHLVDRYGLDEVAQWYFEVWNEPNSDFWGGTPRQMTYFELYAHTARAIKRVSPRLRVGGPATAQAAWVGDFLKHCAAHAIPVDFVSSHAYANDDPQHVLGVPGPVPRNELVCRAVRKNHDEIRASPLPKLPLIYSEFNASYLNEPNVTDTDYMAAWLAETVSRCDGLSEAMSVWTFSDVFEEGGVIRTPFYGGFGVVAEHEIAKPALHALALLHRLGTERLEAPRGPVLVTRRNDGRLVIALWNYAEPAGAGSHYTAPGADTASRSFELHLRGVAARSAALWRVDRDHNNVLKAYDAMGRPAYPTPAQIAQLRRGNTTEAPERVSLQQGLLKITVPARGLALIEIAD